MKSKIKFRLEVWGRTLIFQILEMDERFRSSGWWACEHKSYECYNKVTIWSAGGPDLALSQVFLRGANTDLDDRAVKKVFGSTEDAEVYKVRILDALQDWAKNWPGFKDDTCEKEPGVYEF